MAATTDLYNIDTDNNSHIETNNQTEIQDNTSNDTPMIIDYNQHELQTSSNTIDSLTYDDTLNNGDSTDNDHNDTTLPESNGDVQITEGCQLSVFMRPGEESVRAEVVLIRTEENTDTSQEGALVQGGSRKEYYIHYLDYNKRLDGWVTSDKLDLSKGKICLIYIHARSTT